MTPENVDHCRDYLAAIRPGVPRRCLCGAWRHPVTDPPLPPLVLRPCLMEIRRRYYALRRVPRCQGPDWGPSPRVPEVWHVLWPLPEEGFCFMVCGPMLKPIARALGDLLWLISGCVPLLYYGPPS